MEYSVSKLIRTTTFKSAGGNAGMFTKVFIGPLPNSFPASMFVDCFRVMSTEMSG
jgi:hypothetical protein